MIRRWEIEAIKAGSVDLRRDYDVLQNRLFKLERHLGLAWPGDWSFHVEAGPPVPVPIAPHKHNWYPATWTHVTMAFVVEGQ